MTGPIEKPAEPRALAVIARNTAFTYKGKPTDAKEIGRDLGVRYVLEGSVQPTESRLRVNAQLTDAESGANLWAESFDHDRADLLETEDEIVTRLARSLDLRFTEVEAARAGRLRPHDPTAQDLALRCQAAVDANRADAEKLTKYAPIFEPCEKALAIDPRNVLALALVAARLSRMASIGESVDPGADLARSKDLSARVIAIDPDGAAARGMKANLAYLEGRMQDALNETERAIAANPTDINDYFLHCSAANGAQMPQEAIEYADRAIRLSPRDPLLYRFYLQKGWALTSLGKYADALVWLDRSLSLVPNYTSAFTMKIVALVNSGRDQEAHETYLRYAALPGRHPNTVKEAKAVLDRLASAEVRNEPKYIAEQQRLLDSLHKAGMPDE
jgi:tetratricopeptide (TPR) repeat protein